ncbi:MAG: Tfp pilus assembly protein tip-associated adhesin PilY1-like protein [Betaproteobacteria bacterium]|nr:Tfp pilus assembly protein tip-associated adhesin PilY1-like protein [Betaproteobacteria bacterium]
MNKNNLLKKTVAWCLIATMINPAMMTPAFARDSDIYLASTSGTSTAEPNVLFILGTNDRMNVAEAWREYDPAAYDSHAEYLWNDVNIINSGAEVTVENQDKISTAAPPTNPSSVWGTWSGALNTDRRALWLATLAYAQGTQGTDPGARSTYRNYWDGSWHYWLPTGTATTDQRLWSVSFNRWRGFIQTISGSRGGVTFPSSTTANYNSANDFRSFNLCTTSLTQLEPSTIFAPTGRALNNGYMLNQQWIRYEPYLNLATRNNPVANYPGSHATYVATNGTTYYTGFLNNTAANAIPPTNTAGTGPANGSTNSYRDSLGSNVGSVGQPIRVQKDIPDSASALGTASIVDAGDSYAGWTDVAADLGGFTFQGLVNTTTAGYWYPQAVLTALRGVYGYALPAFTGSTALLQEQFGAYRGNRDGTPAFGMKTGTPAYYDISNGLRGAATGVCDPVTGTNGAGGTTANQCISLAGASQNATWNRTCTSAGPVKAERDASDTIRDYNETCGNNGAITCTFDPLGYNCGTGPLRTVALTPPALNCALTNQQSSFLTRSYNSNTANTGSCAWSGQTTVAVATCQWSGRSSVYIEGQGTYFYGGTCTENGSAASCGKSGGTYVASRTLNGVAQADVTGPFASPAPANGATTLNCNNTQAASNYTYGGTCTLAANSMYTVVTPGPGVVTTAGSAAVAPTNPASQRTVQVPVAGIAYPTVTANAQCQVTAGTASVSIRGATSRTYNQTCSTLGNVDQTCATRYGGICVSNGVQNSNCPASVSANTVGVPGGNNFYQTYQINATTNNLVHECLADGPAGQNPSASYPTAQPRTFNTAANTTANANTTYPANNRTAAYDTVAARGVVADATKNIDIYSTNYMNFLYGAKACRDTSGNLITTSPVSAPPAGATCSPIARKTRLQVAKDALSDLVTSTDGVRLGLMVYNKTDTTTANEGGNLVYSIRRMGSNNTDTPAYTNRTSLVTAIQAVVASSRTPLTETLYEAYRYFSGRAPVYGTLATTAAAGGAVSAGREAAVGNNVDPPSTYANVFAINSTGKYNSPMMNNPNVAGPANCQKNYIVMLTNGQPEDDSAANAAIKTMAYADPTGATDAPRTDYDTAGATPNNSGAPDYRQIPAVAGGSPYGPVDAGGTTVDGGYVWLDELAYFMSKADISPGGANYQSEYTTCSNPVAPGHTCTTPTTTDLLSGRQSIITYTIGFAGISAPVVQNAAAASGGIYYVAQNAQQLRAALQAAFVAIRNWNPTSAAATVPISSLNRGESSTDVYLAFFGPDANRSVWPGTVKKYQVSTSATDCGTTFALCLVGQTAIGGLYNIQTIDPITNQSVVDPTATSGPNDLLHPSGSAWYASTLQDGAKPDKGGTGYVLVNTAGQTPDTRKVYTFLSGSVSNNADLTVAVNNMHTANAAITQAMVGGANAVARNTSINYARGGNSTDPTCTSGTTSAVCATWATWPHGSVEHSKPAVVTYDGTTSPAVQYVYYLQNNGMLTAVDAQTGREKWSFLIEEALSQLPTMQLNNAGPEIYVADGSPQVFYEDNNGDGIINGADRVWLYFGLRRGGRVYYALDITQKDTPLFKWKITAASGTGKVCLGTAACSSVSQFDELGQSWSTPQIGKLKVLDALPTRPPALIFGGGYDVAEDTVPAAARTMGRAVYVINGETAAIVNSWGLGQSGTYRTSSVISTYGFPSDVTALNADFDSQNFLDRVMVGDMGGNVWRFDIDDVDPTMWKGLQLASLSNATGEKRKFFFPPAVAPQNATGFLFDGVYIGSGDKEHPLLTTATTPATTDDRMFMIMDDPSVNSGGGTPDSSGPSGLATPVTLTTMLNIVDSATTGVAASALVGQQGWYRRLDTGEKVVNSPTVFKLGSTISRLRFGTYAPLTQLNACTPPGEGRLNEIDSLTGDLLPINGAVSGPQRYYTSFLGRGFVSSTQLLVLSGGGVAGKNIYTFTTVDAILQGNLVGTIGAPTKIYWYMEPEQ